MTKKSGSLALLINFFLPGLGLVYASDGKVGWRLFLANFVGGLLAPFTGGVTVLVCIVVWFWALADSFAVANRANRQIDAAEIAADHRQRAERIRAERSERDQVQLRASEEKSAERAALARVDAAELAGEVRRLKTLLSVGVLSRDEADAEWQRLLAQCCTGWSPAGFLRFLEPFVELVDEGIIDGDELQTLKDVARSMPSQPHK